MTTRVSKIVAGIATAAALAVSTIALSSPAQAHWHGGFHRGHGWGPFVMGAYDGGYSNCGLVNVYSKSGRYLRTVQRCW